jgi:Response regulator receiver domain
MSGYDVLRSLRLGKVKTPVLILSGYAGIEDKVRALGVGADDYVTKPFHKEELIARIHAIVRRSMGHAEPTVKCGDLTVKPEAKQAEIAGRTVPLTGKEYGMLELLALRQGSLRRQGSQAEGAGYAAITSGLSAATITRGPIPIWSRKTGPGRGDRLLRSPQECVAHLTCARGGHIGLTVISASALDEIEEASPNPSERLLVRGVRQQGD